AVSMTYFVIDRLMRPVIRHLIVYGVDIDYNNLRTSRIFNQMLFSFTLTVVITAMMIATLATQKASNLRDAPGQLDQVVQSLRVQTMAISGCAVLTAIIMSTLLARSVSVPVQEMVRAMRRVEAGYMAERITAISTNEIGMLGRSFNRMVERLEQGQTTIQVLNRQLQGRNQEMERALAELKLAQDRLVHTEKMTSLGELVAGIAHEINNSINTVYNGIIPLRQKIETLHEQMLAAPPGATPLAATAGMKESFSMVVTLARVVENGAKRTTDIVTDLKKFAHPGRTERALFDVHEGLEIALHLLDNKLRNRVTVERSYCADGGILCCGTQLSQVFLNILDNAQHAISGTGTVRIRTQRSSDQLVIRICDTGSGIPPQTIGRIFDPFFTTKDVGVGTGLGLSISYGIVRGHGGSIDVISPPPGEPHGTEFAISLPICADKADSGEATRLTRAAAIFDDSRAGRRGDGPAVTLRS
ncbi:MAG TPA: ATP-binding protein, partial [Phycisphaerae bacterium]